jgi:hypothetical protein
VPFTGSHPAAVLPLMRWGLVPSALVIGSMVPDLPYYLPVPVDAGMTHSPVGTVTVDVVLGGAAFLIWHAVLAPFLLAVSPASVRSRLTATGSRRRTHPTRGRGIVLTAASLTVGAATHTVWDAFTHPGRWGTRHIGWLAEHHAGLPGYQWSQYASGVLGAISIAVWLLRWWHAHRPVAPPASEPGAAWTVLTAWAVIVLAGLAGGLVATLPGADGEGPLRVVFLAGTGAAGGGLIAAMVYASCWTVLSRQR